MANNASFSGLGSGIDFGVITDSIIANRSRPIKQLVAKQANLQGRIDALKQLNTKLIGLNDSINSLKDRTLGTGNTASSTATNVLGATATDSATPGTI